MTIGKYQLAICDRCGHQFKMAELRADGHHRNLLVCGDCYDQKFREPRSRPEIAVTKTRPDQTLE